MAVRTFAANGQAPLPVAFPFLHENGAVRTNSDHEIKKTGKKKVLPVQGTFAEIAPGAVAGPCAGTRPVPEPVP